MANPFEQFDAEKPNPFEQFDSEPAPQAPQGPSHGFLDRAYQSFRTLPRDIVDNFMEGIHTTLRAPGQIVGTGERKPFGMDELGPAIEEQFRTAGWDSEDAIKRETARLLRSAQRQQGEMGLLFGPAQALASPILGAARSFISRPIEEGTGFPKEATEALLLSGAAALGLRQQYTRIKVGPDGVKAEPIGEPPTDMDFRNATRAAIDRKVPESPIVDLEPSEYSDQSKPPQKLLPGPKPTSDPAVIERNLQRLWEEDGIHPAEAINDMPNDPFLAAEIRTPERPYENVPPTPLDPVVGTPVDPGTPRSVLGRTGVPYVDGILNHTDVKHVVDNPVIDRTRTIPNTWGGSVPFENPVTFIDRRLPTKFTVDGVTFDPAHPAALRENAEAFAIDLFRKGGMTPAAALRAAVHLVGTPVEHAWYRAHGLDPDHVERALWPHVDEIASAEHDDIPPDIFRGTYPGDDPTKASPGDIDFPSPEDVGRAIAILQDAGFGSQRSANVSPDALPRTLYPQYPQTPAGGKQPPGTTIGGPGQPLTQPPVGPPGQPPTNAPGGASPFGAGPGGPQGPFINPTPTPVGRMPRQPYFTYDDSNAFVRAFRRSIRTWQETFQPELISDLALQADPFFAEYKSANQNLRDQITLNQEAGYQYWRGVSEADRLLYLELLETNQPMPTQSGWQARADLHRQILDKAHQIETQWGSRADYFDSYFPHIFENPEQARDYVAGRTAQVGPNWFQKERTFSSIAAAMREGLRLKDSNPDALVTARLYSTADMVERMNLIFHMRDLGAAVTVRDARAQRAQRIAAAQALGLPIDVSTVGRDLSAEGWQVINAPGAATGPQSTFPFQNPDRQWFIAPDVRPLWQNAVDAKGLWANEGNVGSMFRGWMAFKAAWVPLKLALSAFHPLHVLHINMTGHITQAIREAAQGQFGDAMRELGDIVYDPIAAASYGKLTHEGRFAREAWNIPEDARTPLQQAIVKTMNEGGLVANISEELRANALHAFQEAVDKSDYFRMLPAMVREGVRRLGAPIFEEWIPNLKVAAYLRAAGDFLQQNPHLLNDEVQRRVALRTIAKSMENRYGEMFYGGLFWNRTLKDAGIGAMLSLGWNAGFVREFGGAVSSPIFRGIRGVRRAPTQTEQTIAAAQTKLSYAFTYAVGAMLMAGMITYASTGEDPDGMDWFLPRTGRNNPDGTPHRISNMFYTREIPMLEKHIQAKDSLRGGIWDTLQSKLVTQPLSEMSNNRDYFGNEIWSPENPIHKQGQQMLAHFFGSQLSPMSITGAQTAMKTGGGFGEAALAILGFGPAPSYANKTPTQNYIEHLFQRYVVPQVRPQELGKQSVGRGDLRNQILMAQNTGDQAAVQSLAQKWFKAGGTRQGLTNILQRVPGDISMFKALQQPQQEAVMARASETEKQKYAPYLKTDIVNRIADMKVDMIDAQKTGDADGANKIAEQIRDTMNEAVHSGKITNIGSFNRSLNTAIRFRLNPQEATEKANQADVRRRKRFEDATRAPAPPQ